MAVRMMDLLSGNLDTLRYEPTAKWVSGGPSAVNRSPTRTKPGWFWTPPRRTDLRGTHHRADSSTGAGRCRIRRR